MPKQPAIERLEWDSFYRGFSRSWRAGEHVLLLGPTGRGKTHLASEILALRKYMIALDVKGGGDPSFRRMVADGFEQVATWPLKDERRRLRSDEPIRLVLSPPVRHPQDLPDMAKLFDRVLSDVFVRGGWSVYIDECRLISAPRHQGGMGLGPALERLILTKRFEGVSVVASSQAPRWIPRAVYDQPVHSFFWRNRDFEQVRRLAEISGGMDRKVIATAVQGLGFHDVLYVGGRRERMVITRAPK